MLLTPLVRPQRGSAPPSAADRAETRARGDGARRSLRSLAEQSGDKLERGAVAQRRNARSPNEVPSRPPPLAERGLVAVLVRGRLSRLGPPRLLASPARPFLSFPPPFEP